MVCSILCLVVTATTLLVCTHASDGESSPECYTVSDERWENLVRGFVADWQGLWIRATASGKVISASNSTRKFEILANDTARPPRALLQTNTHSNPQWNADGDTFRQWWHTPAQLLRRLYANGTLGPPSTSASYFFRTRDALVHSPARLPQRPRWGFEKYLTSPTDRRVRFSVVPLYIRGDFALFIFIRDYDGPPPRAAPFWSPRQESRVRDALPRLPQPRSWSRTRTCMRASDTLACTEELPASGGDLGLPAQPKNSMVTLELPDGVWLHVPKTVRNYESRDLQMMLLWFVDSRTIRKTVLTFDRKGSMVQECTSTYTKKS